MQVQRAALLQHLPGGRAAQLQRGAVGRDVHARAGCSRERPVNSSARATGVGTETTSHSSGPSQRHRVRPVAVVAARPWAAAPPGPRCGRPPAEPGSTRRFTMARNGHSASDATGAGDGGAPSARPDVPGAAAQPCRSWQLSHRAWSLRGRRGRSATSTGTSRRPPGRAGSRRSGPGRRRRGRGRRGGRGPGCGSWR